MSIRNDDGWYMIADQDISGTAYLYLNVDDKDYPLLSSPDLAAVYPGIDRNQAREYYNALIREAAGLKNYFIACFNTSSAPMSIRKLPVDYRESDGDE